MATSVPPHNAAELCDAALHLIKHPNAGTEKLMQFVPGPDFPTGGTIIDTPATILEAYATGRAPSGCAPAGRRRRLGRGTWQIVVTEMPYQVQKGRLVERIAELLTEQQAAAARRCPRRIRRGCAPGPRAEDAAPWIPAC